MNSLNKKLTITFLFLSAVVFSVLAEEKFSIIVLPDTQNYMKYKNADKKFLAQTKWIAENKDKLNIKFVIHEGDIVDDNSSKQWKKAREIMSVLDNKVPYAMCVGNHDIGYNGPKKSPVCKYFKLEDYEDKEWWGGKMPDENCFYYTFNTADDKYLVLSLNFGPSDSMLDWADKIIKKHPDHKVLMTTHVYVADNGKLSNRKSKKNAGFYGNHANGESRNTGQQLWDKHVKKHRNYLMVFSGHLRGPAARNCMKGENGNKIHQMLANYQYEAGGGNGFLRILEFDPKNNTCSVKTYSPYKKKYLKDEKNQFSLDL